MLSRDKILATYAVDPEALVELLLATQAELMPQVQGLSARARHYRRPASRAGGNGFFMTNGYSATPQQLTGRLSA